MRGGEVDPCRDCRAERGSTRAIPQKMISANDVTRTLELSRQPEEIRLE